MDVCKSSSTAELALKQALAPQATMPMAPLFWAVGPSDQVARRGLATSSRAQGKMPIIQAEWMPPAKTDKELSCWLQVEELEAEEARLGRDVATLEVVMDISGLLTGSRL